jgi:hypothetical protein
LLQTTYPPVFTEWGRRLSGLEKWFVSGGMKKSLPLSRIEYRSFGWCPATIPTGKNVKIKLLGGAE